MSVRRRPDRNVLIGYFRRFRAARVDDHHLAAAFPDGFEPTGHAGCCQQAAAGRHRVGAHDDEKVGAFDVGHRDRGLVTEKEPGRQQLRGMIDAGCREYVRRPEAGGECKAVHDEHGVMDGGVAEVAREAVRALLLTQCFGTVGNLGERGLPRHFLEIPAAALEWPPHEIRIVL